MLSLDPSGKDGGLADPLGPGTVGPALAQAVQGRPIRGVRGKSQLSREYPDGVLAASVQVGRAITTRHLLVMGPLARLPRESGEDLST